MPQFTDASGKAWQVGITVADIKRVRALLGVDLADLTSGETPLIQRLSIDYVLVCDVLYVLCKPQADAQGITDEQFGQAMGGEALSHGMNAFMEALENFFRSLSRTEMARAVKTMRDLVRAAVQTAEARLEAIDPEKLSASMSGDSSTAAPESADSTRLLSPSAN